MCANMAMLGGKAAGKHLHTVYSHCIERMLLIMEKEDGSSLRRTHPHITRSVKKGLVVIVASPACALSHTTRFYVKTQQIQTQKLVDLSPVARKRS